jgi:signal transduction histidine kinase
MTGMTMTGWRVWLDSGPWRRAAAVVALAAVVSWLHYGTNPDTLLLHEVYQYLYYLPLVLAAYWGGVRGGLSAAFLISLLFIPHIRAMSHEHAAYSISMYAHVIAFYLLGAAVGLAISSQRRLAARERATADSLQKANDELRESDEHLRRADRLAALGEIAAGLAHEIKNPLAGMKGALEIVRTRVAPDTPETEFIMIAERELQRLETLVGDFLAFARPRPPQLAALDLRTLCGQVCELLAPEGARRQIDVRLTVEAIETSVMADRAQLEQVLLNVVLNAIQAGPGRSEVVLRVTSTPVAVSLIVDNAGPGVPPEVAARMFDPFFTTKERGTGLGLAISQRIVLAHGGTIDLAVPPDGGTRVIVSLPRSPGSIRPERAREVAHGSE